MNTSLKKEKQKDNVSVEVPLLNCDCSSFNGLSCYYSPMFLIITAKEKIVSSDLSELNYFYENF